MSGWRSFSAIMIIIGGVIGFFEGLVATFKANYFDTVANGKVHLPAFDKVETWGWVILIVSLVMMFAGIFIFANALWARILALVVVGFNIVLQFFWLPAFPFWALIMILINILVIYGLFAKGDEFARG